MRRTFLLKSMLLLCALVAGSSSVWADDDVTVTWNINGVNNSQTTSGGGKVNTTLKTSSITPEGASGTWTAVSDNDKSYAASSTGAQLGAGSSRQFNGTITLSETSIPSNATIKSVTVNAASNGSSTLSATVGGKSLGESKTISGTSASDYVISGSSQTGNTIVLTLSNTTTSKYINIKKIVVVYTPSTETIDVLGVSLNKETMDLFVGGSEQLTATIVPDLATNKNVSWESNTPSVATVDDEGNVTAVAEGTATITVTTEDGGFTASCVVTVKPVPQVVVTFDLTNAGWGFPTDYDKTEKSYSNNGYTLSFGTSSTGHKVLKSGDDITALIFGKENATLKLPAFGFNVGQIKVYGNSSASASVTFNIFVGDDAVSTEATSSKATHEFTIDDTKRAAGNIYTIKVTNANNCQISKIEVFGDGCEAGLVQSYGWATFIPSVDVEYPANTAYIVTDASVASGLTLEAVTQVPADTPILLKEEGAKTAKKLDSTPAALSSNLLTISNGTDLAAGKYPYVLAKNGEGACFKQWTGAMSTLNGRVVLVLDEAVAAGSPVFSLDGETTGINTVNGSGFMVNGSEVYNLNGQRVAQPTKGLYIVNGRKVVIK